MKLISILVIIVSLVGSSFCLANQESRLRDRLSKHRWGLGRKPSSANAGAEDLALQRVMKSADQRIEKDPYLLQAAQHSSQRVAQAAILALARIGDPYAVESLSSLLSGKRKELKPLAAFGLGMIGDELAIRLLSQYVAMESHSELRGSYYRALGLSRQLSALATLTKALASESQANVLSQVVEGLGVLWSGDSASWPVGEDALQKLAVLSQTPSGLSALAAFTLSQYKGDPAKIPANEMLTALLKNPLPYARLFLIRSLARVDTPQVQTTLLMLLTGENPMEIRVEAAKSLKGRKFSELTASLFAKPLKEGKSHLVVACLETIQETPEFFKSLTETVDLLAKSARSNWVRGQAIRTLAYLDPEKTKLRISEVAGSRNQALLPSALAAWVWLMHTKAIDAKEQSKILSFFKEGNAKVLSESLELLSQFEAGDFSEEIKAALRELVQKKDPGLVAVIAEIAKQNDWKDFAMPLGEAYQYYRLQKMEDTVETRSAILSSLSLIGSAEENPIFHLALEDESKQVVSYAIRALETKGSKEMRRVAPLNNRVSTAIPDLPSWKKSLGKKVRIRTTQGNIEIRFFENAPMTAYRFLELVQKKFYEGLSFHRVVPNFVVQGGDPRGDGFGGPGFLIRDEVSPQGHERGTLGIATSGKDTGGSQFFFNIVPNYQLNGKYTVFAEVISGLEVMDKLEPGDKILMASLL